MLLQISNWFQKNTKGWIIFLFLALYTILVMYVFQVEETKMKENSGGTGPIDLLFLYSPNTINSMLQAYGEAGRTAYLQFELSWDLLYPIVYTLLFIFSLSWLFKKALLKNNPLQYFNILPIGGWLFDLFENLSIVTMIAKYPNIPIILPWLSTSFTILKWMFAMATLLLLFIGLIAYFKKRYASKNSTQPN
ncbi:MAG: hypothetical protein IPO78_11965 [Saprospiraceae bacterium]|nr:hypothetical protein [Saprospiraceae bacterium]